VGSCAHFRRQEPRGHRTRLGARARGAGRKIATTSTSSVRIMSDRLQRFRLIPKPREVIEIVAQGLRIAGHVADRLCASREILASRDQRRDPPALAAFTISEIDAHFFCWIERARTRSPRCAGRYEVGFRDLRILPLLRASFRRRSELIHGGTLQRHFPRTKPDPPEAARVRARDQPGFWLEAFRAQRLSRDGLRAVCLHERPRTSRSADFANWIDVRVRTFEQHGLGCRREFCHGSALRRPQCDADTFGALSPQLLRNCPHPNHRVGGGSSRVQKSA